MIKLFVVLAAVAGAIALADGRFGGTDVEAAREVVAEAYADAKEALAVARGGMDEPTRRELEDARAKLVEAAEELERAGDAAGEETQDALLATRLKLLELERRIDAALG